MQVEKRDGVVVDFDQERIITAINKAGLAIHKNLDNIPQTIANNISQIQQNVISVESIQDLVIDQLQQSGNLDLAQAYQSYREQRTIQRQKRSKQYSEVVSLLYNHDNKDITTENANKNSKLIPTQRDLLAGLVAREHALNHILPPEVAEAHKSGDIHFHDLDYSPLFPMFNCMLIDLGNMLSLGYVMGNAQIEPPKSIMVACSQTAQIIAQVASHIYGGTSIHEIDVVLSPYVTKSYDKHLATAKEFIEDQAGQKRYAQKLTEKEVYDAFQALEYEINTLHTANGQTPFVTFGFGVGDTWQAKMIQKAILQVRLKGLGKDGHTAIFPKLVFTVKQGLNAKAGDPNYDIKQLALDCAVKRMYPDVLSYEKVVEVTGSYKTPMGCRSFLGDWKNEQGQSVVHGRNNLGVVSLNLPRLAIRALNNEGKGEDLLTRFYSLLDQQLDICYKALQCRLDRLKDIRADTSPILYMYGACGVRLQAEDRVIDIFKNGRASISLGYIGIHETLVALRGSKPIEDNDAQNVGLSIVKYLRTKCEEWKAQTGFGFSVYSTPAESLCYRFNRLDKDKYGLIDGVNDHEYYTNSFHLDVAQKVTPFEKINYEHQYPAVASGGFISYVEFPSLVHNTKALEAVWDYAVTKVPYFGTNTPIDICHECNHHGEFIQMKHGFQCPSCGNTNAKTMNVTRRVCGYLGSPDDRPFNKGKFEEVNRRTKSMDAGKQPELATKATTKTVIKTTTPAIKAVKSDKPSNPVQYKQQTEIAIDLSIKPTIKPTEPSKLARKDNISKDNITSKIKPETMQYAMRLNPSVQEA